MNKQYENISENGRLTNQILTNSTFCKTSECYSVLNVLYRQLSPAYCIILKHPKFLFMAASYVMQREFINAEWI